jgi:hypothetical protein
MSGERVGGMVEVYVLGEALERLERAAVKHQERYREAGIKRVPSVADIVASLIGLGIDEAFLLNAEALV